MDYNLYSFFIFFGFALEISYIMYYKMSYFLRKLISSATLRWLLLLLYDSSQRRCLIMQAAISLELPCHAGIIKTLYFKRLLTLRPELRLYSTKFAFYRRPYQPIWQSLYPDPWDELIFAIRAIVSLRSSFSILSQPVNKIMKRSQNQRTV